MDKDYFMNGGGGIPIPWSGGLNCTSSDQSFMEPNSVTSHFDSSFSSMPSSSSAAASEAFILRELIGKLGGGGGGIGSSIAFPATATPFSGAHNTTPPPPPPPLHSLSGDPGFAERAAKFSCFGSRSFNGRTAAFEMMNDGGGGRSATPPADMHMQRVSSSPCLNPPPAAAAEKKKICLIRQQPQVEYNNNSNEDSSVSDQIPSGETLSKITSNELNTSRKRKSISRPKDRSINPSNNNKRTKPAEENNNGRSNKDEEEEEEDKDDDEKSKEKKTTDHQIPPEPPKDYIHVRARRGQATDSHSLAERVRREKISERMKLLQDLVPGCNKVTGKALMLDEIINYVQSLQRQVEFLSMKLSSVNPGLDFNIENLILSKDNVRMVQQNTSVPQQMYPLDSSSPALFNHHQQNVQQLHNNDINNNNNNNSTISVEPIIHIDHATLCRNLGIQLPCLDRFTHDILPQFPGFSEDDLQSIVQMGFAQNPANFSAVQNQMSNMKVER